MKLSTTFTTIALAGALTIGGATASFAAGNGDGDGTGGGLSADRIAKICEHQDEVVPRLTERQTKLTERIAKLTELQAKATDKGRDRLADRIGQRIERLEAQLTKVTERIAKAPAWIAEHCD